jgi:hypothetical protein
MVFGYREYHFNLSCIFSQKTVILIHFYHAYIRLYPFYLRRLCVVFLAVDDTEHVTIFWNVRRKDGHNRQGCLGLHVFILRAYRDVGGPLLVAQWRRHCATNRKVAGSIPGGVIWIFHWHNPSDRTMALGSNQPLTEISTRSISWGYRRPVRKADNLTTILCRCHVIWEP